MLINKDASAFYDQYVLGNKVNEEKAAFDEGTFTHALILEPEKISEFAIYNGLRKSGPVFQDFKDNNAGKIVLSMPQVLRCQKMYESYKAMTVANELISGGLPEHTMVSQV